MFLAVSVGKWKMFLAVFVGKWKMFCFFRVIAPGITISNKLDCSALNLQYLYIRRAAFRHNNFKQV